MHHVTIIGRPHKQRVGLSKQVAEQRKGLNFWRVEIVLCKFSTIRHTRELSRENNLFLYENGCQLLRITDKSKWPGRRRSHGGNPTTA